MSMRKQPPCYGCMEHQCNCHSNCEAYLEWRKNYNEVRSKMKSAIHEKKAADEILIKGAIRTARRKGKR